MVRSRLWFIRFGLGTLIALMIGGSALAASNSIYDVRVSPRGTVCLSAIYALNSAEVQGSATQGGATFTVYSGSAPGQLRPIYSTAPGTTSFRNFYTQFVPQGAVIPGYFRLCATNSSSVNNTRITMSVITDGTP